MKNFVYGLAVGLSAVSCLAQEAGVPKHIVVLHAARMLDVAGGRIVTPGEVLELELLRLVRMWIDLLGLK
jgi:hypothetical protein